MTQLEHIEAKDWYLAPVRYVGVKSEDLDEDFDFEKALRDMHSCRTGRPERRGRSTGRDEKEEL